MSKLNPTTAHYRSRTSSRCFSFGLGCLQFLPAKRSDKIKISQYCSDLDQFLRRIPAVGDVRVDPGYGPEEAWYGATPLPGDNEYIWPATGLEIHMTLHIPSRVQEEMREGLSTETGAENFFLMIKHCYYSPVAIVVPDSESDEAKGSSSVYLIRNFLNGVIEEGGAARFLLDFMGSSPFHADFSIREQDLSEDPDSKISITPNVQYGYDEIVWHVNTKHIKFDEAIDAILEGIRNDADSFYEIMQRRSMLLRSWIGARRLAEGVIELEQETSLGRRIKNYPRKARHIKNAIMSVAEYQMLDIAGRSQLTSMLKEHVWAEHGGIRKFCEHEFDDLEKFPAAELRELLQFLENRVRHVDNVIIALLAAMIGGLVGGTLGVVAA